MSSSFPAREQLPTGALRISTLLLVASVGYFILLSISTGHYNVRCLIASVSIIGLVAVAAAILPSGTLRSYAWRGPLMLAILLIQSIVAWTMPATRLLACVEGNEDRYAGPIAVATTLAMIGCLWLARTGRRKSMLCALVATAVGIFICVVSIQRSAKPVMDVWFFHHDAAAALIDGKNPYAITYLNTLNEDGKDDSVYYSREVQKNGRLMFGYVYPPLCLFMVLPGEWFTGDSRLALIAYYLAAAVMIAAMDRGSGLAISGAAILLVTPCTYAVYRASWTEPTMMLLLAWIAWCGVKRSAWLAVALGLFFAVKQYCPIFTPLLLLIWPRPLAMGSSVRFAATVTVTACLVTLPLALWDWPAFWNSTVHIQVIQPFRFDSFSFLSMIALALPDGHPPPSSAWAFIVLLPVEAMLLWKLPRNIAGFTLGVGVTMMAFLFLNRQSFLNYHTFAASALLIAAATYERVYAQLMDGHRNHEADASGRLSAPTLE